MIQKNLIGLLLFLMASTSYAQTNINDVNDDIEELNIRMEEHFQKGDLKKIADMYHENAYIVSPGNTTSGRKEIEKYWTGIKDPVSWDLEIIEISELEEDIYDNQYYQALKNKPPGWRQRGIELDDDMPLIYQLGRSTLQSRDDAGEIHASVVDFILVWQAQSDGRYLIIMDTYTW